MPDSLGMDKNHKTLHGQQSLVPGEGSCPRPSVLLFLTRCNCPWHSVMSGVKSLLGGNLYHFLQRHFLQCSAVLPGLGHLPILRVRKTILAFVKMLREILFRIIAVGRKIECSFEYSKVMGQ